VVAEPNISGYTIIALLGSGGFASVYLATDDLSGRRTAIKVLHEHASKPDDLRRFERERVSLRALSGHPNIVRVYGSGETDDGQHYTVLEYIDGGSVRDKIDKSGALHWTRTVEIGVQICAALDIAHRSGVLHRDVKPANILLDENLAKLSDFGIARLVGQSQVTAAQSIIGTLAYTPPEVFHNKPFDGRGDIYQLGISLYEMLLGRAPFTSAAADNKATVIRRILDHPAPPLAQFDIPEPLSNLLDEVLAKDPADRPQSAESFGRRLNDVEVQMGRTPTEIGVGVDTEMIVPTSANSLATSTDETARDDIPGDQATRAVVPESIWPGAAPELLKPPEPPEPKQDMAPTKHRRWPWLVGLLVLVGAVGGSVFAWQYVDRSKDTDPTADPTVELGDEDLTPRVPEFVALDDPAFSEPGGTDGVIFASVANSFGLTMVGGAGNGEEVSEQRSVVWTLGPVDGERTIRMRSDFAQDEGVSASNQRLWDIAVLDGQQLLAVGENQGGGGTNGIAWIGDQARFLRPANDPSFQTAARESLRGASGHPDRKEFIVVGSRGAGNNLVMGLWTLAEGAGWATPTWSAIDVGTGADGVLNDVAVEDELAVAVGSELTNGEDAAVLLIRREDTWSNLITPISNSVFHSVAITGERIIAVGEKNASGGPTPFAVVTDTNGTGFIHNLPIRGTTGIARSIAVVDGGRVVVVGDVLGETDRDGALWELLPAEDLGDDVWTTRATPDLQIDGFTELWAIDEFDDVVYVFGRTEQGNTRPAGAWTLDLMS
jgi:serine/threonine protein kinase